MPKLNNEDIYKLLGKPISEKKVEELCIKLGIKRHPKDKE